MSEFNSSANYDSNDEIPETVSWFYHPPASWQMNSDDVKYSHFWSTLEAISWISTRNHDVVHHIGKLVSEYLFPIPSRSALGQMLLIVSKDFCSCGAKDFIPTVDSDGCYSGPTTFWNDCTCCFESGNELYRSIECKKISPINPETNSIITADNLFKLIASQSCKDWNDEYGHLRFKSSQVIKAFSARLSAAVRNAKHKITSRTACEEFLRSQFGTPDGLKKPKKILRAEAKDKIEGLNSNTFNEAWKHIAPQYHRNLPGRPAKKLITNKSSD